MGNEDLDYTIVFPEPELQEGCRWDKEREPVVILLGWGGCKDQHLAKYSTMYHNLGCIVLRHTAAWKAIFITESFGLRSLQGNAKKLLKLLFDYEIDENPIFFHVFSNGGFMLYRYVVELLHTCHPFRKLCIAGTVFDSAPGNRNVCGSLRALDTILRPTTNTVLRYMALTAFALFVIILRILLYPLTRFLHENHYDAMKKDPSRWPHLYLYSRSDPIISYLDVEEMITSRRRRGLATEALDFHKSEHVCHYRRYPQRYTGFCIRFLRNCIKKSTQYPLKREHHLHL